MFHYPLRERRPSRCYGVAVRGDGYIPPLQGAGRGRLGRHNGTQRGHQPPHTAPECGSMGKQVLQGHISHTPKFWTGGLRGRSRIQPSAR
jgi:hypothetical protein